MPSKDNVLKYAKRVIRQRKKIPEKAGPQCRTHRNSHSILWDCVLSGRSAYAADL